MTNDRKVSVNEADLRWLLDGTHTPEIRDRVRATLDALGPEPCGHPSAQRYWSGKREPAFRCIAPTGHHAYDHHRPCCDEDNPDDPIHCGDAHVPPREVWVEQ